MEKIQGICDHCMQARLEEFDQKCAELFPPTITDLYKNNDYIALATQYCVPVISIQIESNTIELCPNCIKKAMELI